LENPKSERFSAHPKITAILLKLRIVAAAAFDDSREEENAIQLTVSV